jgi:hypothetical protein
MALTLAVGSQTRVIYYALFGDDPFLPGCDAVSLGFIDYRRFKHVAPKLREISQQQRHIPKGVILNKTDV